MLDDLALVIECNSEIGIININETIEQLQNKMTELKLNFNKCKTEGMLLLTRIESITTIKLTKILRFNYLINRLIKLNCKPILITDKIKYL